MEVVFINTVAKEITATDKSKIKPTYLILGSGSFGFALAKELRELDKELIIVDKDSQKVETLREEAYEAMEGDVSDPKLFDTINTKNLAGILILSSDPKANKAALKNIREKVSQDIYCVVRAPDVINMQEMESMGADLVIMPPRMVAKSLSRSLERAEAMRRGNKLTQWFETNREKKLAIVVHDNPDPDAISSALALKTIATHFNVISDIIYHGEIGHQENKALLTCLE
ncbi:MAG: NAD-binding protein [Methanolobus sp.]